MQEIFKCDQSRKYSTIDIYIFLADFFHSVKLQGKSHLNLNSFDLSSNGSYKQLDTVKSCEVYIETCLTFYSFLHLFFILGYNHPIHRKYMINP